MWKRGHSVSGAQRNRSLSNTDLVFRVVQYSPTQAWYAASENGPAVISAAANPPWRRKIAFRKCMLQILILRTFHSLFNRGKMKIIYMTNCNHKWGPTACCSKANKEARLVEGKVCFILDVEEDSCPKDNPPLPTPTIGDKSFYRQRGEATCRNSTVSSDHHLEIGHAVVRLASSWLF